MFSRLLFACVCVGLAGFVYPRDQVWMLSNLDDGCLDCICKAVTGCNRTYGCKEGYCGPFRVSRLYWIDAGKQTLPGASLEDEQKAYEDCTQNYECSVRVVKGYIKFLGNDCNGDGLTDCKDFLMMHMNGGWACTKPLETNANAGDALQRYRQCRGLLS